MVRVKSFWVTDETDECGSRVSMSYGCGGTDLSGLKLETFDLIRVGSRGYDLYGSERVSQGLIRMGHGGWDGSFFFSLTKKINHQNVRQKC
jgi:hypothetical protein